jgi:hypothetical protein
MTPSSRRERSRLKFFALLTVAVLLTACDRGRTASNVRAPGTKASTRTQVLETGASLLQRKLPLDALDAYLDGFHFYSGSPRDQMEAHHYCGHLNQDVIQCVIFDGNAADAKLMGVEYIISAALFRTLPTQEKTLWHSHVHEVRSGQLIAPGIPEVAEHALMEELASTYGKTWHTWNTDLQQQLPLGLPKLMMGFTSDGQIDESLVEQRDRRFHISSASRREQRADITYSPIDPQADAWEKGHALQLDAVPASSDSKR